VTENNSEGGHRTGEGNLLLCSTALTYLQDFFQVVKSKYETIGTENLKQSFSSCLQLRCCHHFKGMKVVADLGYVIEYSTLVMKIVCGSSA
jgi:hypothetical protein